MLIMKNDTAKHWRNSKKIRFVCRKIIVNRANVLKDVSLRSSRCRVVKYIIVIEVVIAQKLSLSQCLHIDRYIKNVNLSFISSDNHTAMEDTVKYLKEKNYKNIRNSLKSIEI